METTEPDLVLKSAAVSLAVEVALVKIARIRGPDGQSRQLSTPADLDGRLVPACRFGGLIKPLRGKRRESPLQLEDPKFDFN